MNTTEQSWSNWLETAGIDDERQEILNRALSRLDNLIGMEETKHQISDLLESIHFTQLKESYTGREGYYPLRLFFLGAPGVGKFTVAHILGDILFSLGFLSRPDVKAVTPSDLIGEYVGQTAEKTSETFEDARGGVFFLTDFLDLMTEDGGSGFGQEALDVLAGKIYGLRGTSVILAGSSQDVEDLLDANAGLRAKFNFYLTFDSYSVADIVDISVQRADKYCFVLSESARTTLADKVSLLGSEGLPSIDALGNARFADNLIEASAINHQTRLMGSGDLKSLPDEAFITLTDSDILRAFEEVTSR